MKPRSERTGLRKKKTRFRAEYFVKTGIVIPAGAKIRVYLRDHRWKSKMLGGVGFKDLPIGSKTVRFSKTPFDITHRNFRARVHCLN